jgi:prepilin-type N-terminal cleavage/methylation domain-containing protein
MHRIRARGVQSGFSLIELVAVLVIIGALAVFVAPRLNITGFSQYSFHEELLAAARHAQKTATATRCSVQFEVDAAADSYAATFADAGPPQPPGAGPPQCTDGNALSAPGRGGDLAGSAPDGVDVTTGATVTFDGFGVPGEPSTVTVTLAGGRQVVFEANTGYVHD